MPKLAEELPKAINALREKTDFFNWLEDFVASGDDKSPAFTDKLTGKLMGLFATTFGALTGFFIILFVGLYLSFTPFYYVGLVLVKMLYVEDVLGDSMDVQGDDDSSN